MVKKTPVQKAIGKEARRKPAKRVLVLDIVEQIRQLAWAGQHARAIELASEALRTPSSLRTRSSDQQMDLLDLRAESYIAQGKLDLAAKDAKAMMKLGTTAALKAQALNRLALVQMRTGDLKAAIKSATRALKAAQQTKQKKESENKKRSHKTRKKNTHTQHTHQDPQF